MQDWIGTLWCAGARVIGRIIRRVKGNQGDGAKADLRKKKGVVSTAMQPANRKRIWHADAWRKKRRRKDIKSEDSRSCAGMTG
jgi:hypothetical protein